MHPWQIHPSAVERQVEVGDIADLRPGTNLLKPLLGTGREDR